jgi:hypothetical protein
VGTAVRGWAQICIPTDEFGTFRLGRDDSIRDSEDGERDRASIGARRVEFEEREDSKGGCTLKDVGE